MSDTTFEDHSTPTRGKSVKGERALESLNFRARTTGQDAAARSRLVRRLRIIMPTVAVLLIVLFLINTRSNTVDQAFLDDFKTIAASTEELRMANPRFAGVDDEGKPFEITAIAASQDRKAKRSFASNRRAPFRAAATRRRSSPPKAASIGPRKTS